MVVSQYNFVAYINVSIMSLPSPVTCNWSIFLSKVFLLFFFRIGSGDRWRVRTLSQDTPGTGDL